jgi:nucleotide-binding universal stress UspA family protein
MVRLRLLRGDRRSKLETCMYKMIIAAVDFARLDKAERILCRAKAMVNDDGQIVAISVIENVPSYLMTSMTQDYVDRAIMTGEEKLEELCRRIGIRAVVDIRTGPPAAAILACAHERHADLIIVGSHVPDLSNYFLGANADRIVRHAKCSVLIDRH